MNYKTTPNLSDYNSTFHEMLDINEDVSKNRKKELIWFLELNHVYTKGITAKSHDEISIPKDIKIIRTNRGGKYTYHGPGQRIVYVFLNVKKRNLHGNEIVHLLEKWLIFSLKTLGINSFIIKDKIGIWVKFNKKFCKIAAIGLRIKNGVTMHGIAININPNLKMFDHIVPCGIKKDNNFFVTSTYQVAKIKSFEVIDKALKNNFNKYFND